MNRRDRIACLLICLLVLFRHQVQGHLYLVRVGVGDLVRVTDTLADVERLYVEDPVPVAELLPCERVAVILGLFVFRDDADIELLTDCVLVTLTVADPDCDRDICGVAVCVTDCVVVTDPVRETLTEPDVDGVLVA